MPRLSGLTTPCLQTPIKSLRSWDPLVQCSLLRLLTLQRGESTSALLSLCFALVNLLLLMVPVCLSLNSFSDETKNFLAPGLGDPNPVTLHLEETPGFLRARDGV
jgi:hypothetical protein